jgi:hypothetical protein
MKKMSPYQQAHHLQQVVLNNISYYSVLIKVTTSSFRAKRLLESKNDALDAVSIPNVFHPKITKSHNHQVLN